MTPQRTTARGIAPRSDKRTMARSAGILYLVGCALVGISTLLPADEEPHRIAIATVLLLPLAIGAYLLDRGERLPYWAFHVLSATATVIVGVLIVLSNAAVSPYAFLYAWVLGWSAAFLTWRAIGLQCLFVAVSYGVVLISHGQAGSDVARWMLTVGTLIGVAILVGWLTAEVRRRTDQLEKTARTDVLTGLPNRRAWDEALPRELERAGRDLIPLCVAILDLDHFKDFNDASGHQAGDRLLRAAAGEWSTRVRTADVLARYGGEEFSLLLPGCGLPDAEEIVEKLRTMVPEEQSCSAGIAQWDGTESAESLVARADGALYEAKRNGRDRIVLSMAA